MVSWWIARGNLSDPRSEVSRQLHPPLSCADAQIVVPWCDTMCDQTCSQRLCSKKGEEKHHYHRDNNHNKYFKQLPAGAASATFHDSSAKLIKMSNYRRLVCLSLSKEVWKSNFRQYAQMKSRDGKSQRREEKRREEDQKRESLRRKKIQVRKKVGKSSQNAVFYEWFVALEGRKVGSLKRRVRSHVVRWEVKSCTPSWREAHFQGKMCKACHVRTTFGSWDVEKVHAVVARNTFPSQNCTKHLSVGPLLEDDMSTKCTPLWCEAHFEVKSLKN